MDDLGVPLFLGWHPYVITYKNCLSYRLHPWVIESIELVARWSFNISIEIHEIYIYIINIYMYIYPPKTNIIYVYIYSPSKIGHLYPSIPKRNMSSSNTIIFQGLCCYVSFRGRLSSTFPAFGVGRLQTYWFRGWPKSSSQLEIARFGGAQVGSAGESWGKNLRKNPGCSAGLIRNINSMDKDG